MVNKNMNIFGDDGKTNELHSAQMLGLGVFYDVLQLTILEDAFYIEE